MVGRGVGCRAVEILPVFAQFCPYVLPVNDLRIHKGLQLTYDMHALPATRSLQRTGRVWVP